MDEEPLVLGAIGEGTAQRALIPHSGGAKAELPVAAAPCSPVGTGEAARDDSDESLAISSLCVLVATPAATRSGGPRPEAAGGGGGGRGGTCAAACACRAGGEGDSLELS